jgi:hypothetical protein
VARAGARTAECFSGWFDWTLLADAMLTRSQEVTGHWCQGAAELGSTEMGPTGWVRPPSVRRFPGDVCVSGVFIESGTVTGTAIRFWNSGTSLF